jgi:ribosome-binding factor A
MADKKGRVNEIIQRNLSEIIIYQLKDPITQFASINEVKVTDDYSYCKVYCSHVQEEKADELVNYLNNNAKKIRTLLSKTLSIFKTPELFFIRDVSFEKGKAMDDLIEKAVHSKPKNS